MKRDISRSVANDFERLTECRINDARFNNKRVLIEAEIRVLAEKEI